MLNVETWIGLSAAAIAGVSAVVAVWQGASARKARVATEIQAAEAIRARAAAELQNELTREALEDARVERTERELANRRLAVAEFVSSMVNAAHGLNACMKYTVDPGKTPVDAQRQFRKYLDAMEEVMNCLPKFLPIASDLPFLAEIRRVMANQGHDGVQELMKRRREEGSMAASDPDFMSVSARTERFRVAATEMQGKMIDWLSARLRAATTPPVSP